MNEATSNRGTDAQSVSLPNSTMRWGALVAGGSLAVLGLSQRTKSGLALASAGGLFAYMGFRGEQSPRVVTGQGEVLVSRDVKDVYKFWRSLDNFPSFMEHVESVTTSPDNRSIWTLIGPMGKRVTLESTIVNERENESFSWRSVPGSVVSVEGSLDFRRAPADRGTIVHATIRLSPESPSIARALRSVMGKYPDFLVRHNLRRFKAFIESGEVPTTDGQPHGPRTTKIAVLRLADPTRPFRPRTRFGEALETLRRIA